MSLMDRRETCTHTDHLSLASCPQGKTVIQAEIDAAAELIDFFRFNAMFAMELEGAQPISVPPSTNSVVYRGLEVAEGQGQRGSCWKLRVLSHHPPNSPPRVSWPPSPPLTSLPSVGTWQECRP